MIATSATALSAAEPVSFDAVGKDFTARVHPLLKQFCNDCHASATPEGELDLERFATLTDVRKDPKAWIKVVEMLDNGEMPPKKSPQPTDTQRKELRGWAKRYLDAEARANAGDPGPVVLRRLSNVEYDNTIRDLTGVDLKPAREFPVDGAAGEGFTNVGSALPMSPALLDKYLAAARGIAEHAVLLPDGFRFSDKTTRRDWTNDLVARIQAFYRQQASGEGSTRVNLHGLTWDTNAGGRIALEPYFAALLANRDALAAGSKSSETVAKESNLSPKYLGIVWNALQSNEPSPVLDQVRARWRTAKPSDIPALVAEIKQWQTALTKFNSVGHFKPWMEPVNPLVESQTFRLKRPEPADPKTPAPKTELTTGPAGDVTISLVVRDAGDGRDGDVVEWRDARLEAPGRPSILLRDIRDGRPRLLAKRQLLASTAKYLSAIEEVRAAAGPADVAAVAKARGLDPAMLSAWLGYLGVAGQADATISGYFTKRQEKGGGYDFIRGWGAGDLPNITANSSDQQVRVPGIMKPHSIAVHPTPTQSSIVAWRSPVAGFVKVETRVAHAHPECGNGVAWVLEQRRGGERRRLAAGEIDRSKAATIEPIDKLAVKPGELVSLHIGPRANDHTCDLTEIELTITELNPAASEKPRVWSLSRDVSPDIHAGNPHADSLGNRDVWHFYQEKLTGDDPATLAAIPRGSLLDRWRDETDRATRDTLATQLDQLFGSETQPQPGTPDAVLFEQLRSLGGPLLGRFDLATLAADPVSDKSDKSAKESLTNYGLPRAMFGKAPSGKPAAPASLVVEAPSTLQFTVPAELFAGREFIVTALLDGSSNGDGTAQAQALLGPPPTPAGLVAGQPILVRNGSPAKARAEKAYDAFRHVFPAAVCYSQIVPVDEVVTVVLFHREDQLFAELMLNDAQRKDLDRLWDELRYVSQDALKVAEAYIQFMEYVTQDGDVRLFEPLRKPINERAAAFRKRLVDTEPAQLDALVAFAAKAWRRPLSDGEKANLRKLYARLREQDLDHEATFRLTLARILVAPSFLYKAEEPAAGPGSQPVSDLELASRLSYFLWSSTPDDELRAVAAAGKLRDPDTLVSQMRRMLKDEKARALATEFACQWLDIRGFDTHNEKSDQVFPQFAELRGPMYEEVVRFFVDLFHRDGSVLDVVDADHTFLNEALAKHYGIPGVTGAEWRRVDGIKARGRGGILGMAVMLSKQSGASRTSPILRGNWLAEFLLGEKLPKPPKNVPQLPDSELETAGLTLRQITEKHRSIESCAKCHERIDPFGFALEGFDAIGRRRTADLAGRPIDTRVQLKDGTEFTDLAGLRDYVLAKRRDEYLHTFCKKLLGYALGRGTQLSDEPLLEEMQKNLEQNGYRFSAAAETIVRSRQFLTIRSAEATAN